MHVLVWDDGDDDGGVDGDDDWPPLAPPLDSSESLSKPIGFQCSALRFVGNFILTILQKTFI